VSCRTPADAALTDVDLLQGLLYAHSRANANTSELCDTSATVEALVELLADAELLDRDALDGRRREASERLRREYLERGMGVAMQEFDVSKYAFDGGAEIDCEARLPLCGAACCRLPLALSPEDVREGVIRWELGRPYLIAREDDGYCTHMERGTHRCGVYAQRPIPCRGYDCRQDARIWLDFDARVVNPRLDDPDWPDCLADEGDGPTPTSTERLERCSTISTAA
jgi:hypothetical protein